MRVALLTGSQYSNWGSLASKRSVAKWHKYKGKPKAYRRCEVADESVVVSKAWPEKPGNGVEEKTELTISNKFDGAPICQKQSDVAKGGSRR